MRDALRATHPKGDFVPIIRSIEAAAEQRGRDQWLHATAHGARQWEGLLARFDLAEDADADAVIEAARSGWHRHDECHRHLGTSLTPEATDAA